MLVYFYKLQLPQTHSEKCMFDIEANVLQMSIKSIWTVKMSAGFYSI